MKWLHRIDAGLLWTILSPEGGGCTGISDVIITASVPGTSPLAPAWGLIFSLGDPALSEKGLPLNILDYSEHFWPFTHMHDCCDYQTIHIFTISSQNRLSGFSVFICFQFVFVEMWHHGVWTGTDLWMTVTTRQRTYLHELAFHIDLSGHQLK